MPITFLALRSGLKIPTDLTLAAYFQLLRLTVDVSAFVTVLLPNLFIVLQITALAAQMRGIHTIEVDSIDLSSPYLICLKLSNR